MANASPFLVWSFAVLGVLVAAAFPLGVYWASRRLGKGRRMAVAAAAGTALWMALTAGAAASGALGFDGTPPTMVLLMVAILAIALGIGCRGWADGWRRGCRSRRWSGCRRFGCLWSC